MNYVYELSVATKRIDTLKEYLQSCIEIGDWHGVRDAAADIEIMVERIRWINRLLELRDTK